MEMDIRNEIIDKIFKAKKIKNNNFENLEKLLEDMYISINSEIYVGHLKNEMTFFMEEIKKIIDFDFLNLKNIIAVGGGFSSGKSSFLNMIIRDVKLPKDIKPTTAIPTYILNSDKNFSKIYSVSGGTNTTELEFQEYLTHDNLSKLGFNITKIMPYITLGSKLYTDKINNIDVGNICFIDTPGYNSGNLGTNAEDREVALEHMRNAKSIIWLIGLDVNGTIDKYDLEILSDLYEMGDKKIFILLNKADLKIEDEIEEIIEEITEQLDYEDIDVEGIEAFSTREDREYPFYKKRLYEFLKEENELENKIEKYLDKLEELFSEYVETKNIEEYVEKIEIIDEVLEELDEIEDDILENHKNDLANYLTGLKINYNNKLNYIDKFLEKIGSYCDLIENNIIEIFKEIAEKSKDKSITNYINECIEKINND